MAEPTVNQPTTLTLQEPQRYFLERFLVTVASVPGMSSEDKIHALDIWAEIARDTVAVDLADLEPGCTGCKVAYHGQTRVVTAVKGCPVHWKGGES